MMRYESHAVYFGLSSYQLIKEQKPAASMQFSLLLFGRYLDQLKIQKIPWVCIEWNLIKVESN